MVSLPSDALRGRFTRALLERVGLGQLIAKDLSHLVVLAVQVPV